MGSQSHVSRLRRATEHRTATWNQNFAFAMAVPLRNRVIKLEIWGTYDRKRQGKILAHAYIPLFSAMNSGQDPQGQSTGCQPRYRGHWLPWCQDQARACQAAAGGTECHHPRQGSVGARHSSTRGGTLASHEHIPPCVRLPKLRLQ